MTGRPGPSLRLTHGAVHDVLFDELMARRESGQVVIDWTYTAELMQ